jgi:hypothetical protein
MIQLFCLSLSSRRPKAANPAPSQPSDIPLAILRCINDALGNDFIDYLRLTIVVQRCASGVECFALVARSSKAIPVFRTKGRIDATSASLKTRLNSVMNQTQLERPFREESRW